MSLAALLLPGVDARAGSWSGPTYTFSGTDSMGNPWGPDSDPDPAFYISPFPNYLDNGTASGTVTATFIWVPDPNKTDDPPTPLSVKETSMASAGDGDNSSPTADDGLGDAPVMDILIGGVATSQGSHISQQGRQSPAVITRTLSGQCVNGLLMFSYEASIDNRAVAISSDLEPTFHKDAITGLRAQNQRSDSGFMNADTVAPLPSEPAPDGSGYTLQELKSVTYFPIIDYGQNGQWGRNSSYLWTTTNSSLDEPSGTFNAFWPNINVSSPVAKYSNPPITPGQNDYITLKVTDGEDGVDATANYSVLFHGYYEQWQRTATQDHPGNLRLADGSINPEWIYIAINDCPGPAAGSITMGQTYTDSVTEAGSFGGQLSLSAPGVAAFQANESINIGETCTGTVSASYQFAGAPYTKTKYYIAKSYQERWGTCDVYGGDGFQQSTGWYGVYATNPMVLSIVGDPVYSYPH